MVNKKTVILVVLVLAAIISLFFALITSLPKTPPTNQVERLTPTPQPSYQGGSQSKPSTALSVDMQKQRQSDKEFSKTTSQLFNLYPWLDRFPISTSDYFVFFYPAEKQFIATLFISKANVSNQNIIENAEQEVITKIQKMNIKASDYNFKWNIKAK